MRCRCNNKIKDYDLVLDPTGQYCRVCISISNKILNEYQEESTNEEKRRPGLDRQKSSRNEK